MRLRGSRTPSSGRQREAERGRDFPEVAIHDVQAERIPAKTTPEMTTQAAQANPKSRLDFLDFIRFAAMVLMVQGHTLDALVRPDQLDITHSPWNHWYALRGLTAPIFLMLSGTVGMLSLKRNESGRVRFSQLRHRTLWAFSIIALGYFLVFPANRLADLRWLSPDVWQHFLQVNILHLNGLCLLILMGLAALTRSERALAATSVGLGLALILGAPLVQSVDWFRILPEALAAYLSPVHGSLFPLFPHGAYMFLGVGLGHYLKGIPREEAAPAFRRACAAVAATAALATLLLAPFSPPPFKDPFGANPAFSMVRLALVMPLIAGISLLPEWMPRLTAPGAFLGRKSLQVYVGHLLLLYGLPWTPGLASGHFKALGLPGGLAALAVVFTLTFGGIALLDLVKRRSERVDGLLRLSSATLLAWALLF